MEAAAVSPLWNAEGDGNTNRLSNMHHSMRSAPSLGAERIFVLQAS